MFGWRRRSEGFEWCEYVRTTVLVRRADRQRRVEDVRDAAFEKAKNARDIGLDIGKAGVSYAGDTASGLMGALGAILFALLKAVFEFVLRWLKFFGAILVDALRAVAGPLVDATIAFGNAVRAKTPDLVRMIPIRWKHVGYAAAGLAVIYIGGPILRSADGTPIGSASSPFVNLIPDIGSTGSLPERSESSKPTDIRGRVRVVSADALRVGGSLVRLAGVEAPAEDQPCLKANGRRVKCAAAARSAVSAMLSGRTIACTVTREDNDGNVFAECNADGDNVNAEVVRSGYAFAANDSYFGSLSGEEATAKSAKAGLWEGEVDRPAAWRDKSWDDAKRDAPDGCPIKGTVRSASKVYVLPWSPDYRRAKVRSDRGGRWFCSEDEARAAGFVSADRS